MRICDEPDCGIKHYGKGKCEKHWKNVWLKNHPEVLEIRYRLQRERTNYLKSLPTEKLLEEVGFYTDELKPNQGYMKTKKNLLYKQEMSKMR